MSNNCNYGAYPGYYAQNTSGQTTPSGNCDSYYSNNYSTSTNTSYANPACYPPPCPTEPPQPKPCVCPPPPQTCQPCAPTTPTTNCTPQPPQGCYYMQMPSTPNGANCVAPPTNDNATCCYVCCPQTPQGCTGCSHANTCNCAPCNPCCAPTGATGPCGTTGGCACQGQEPPQTCVPTQSACPSSTAAEEVGVFGGMSRSSLYQPEIAAGTAGQPLPMDMPAPAQNVWLTNEALQIRYSGTYMLTFFANYKFSGRSHLSFYIKNNGARLDETVVEIDVSPNTVGSVTRNAIVRLSANAFLRAFVDNASNTDGGSSGTLILPPHGVQLLVVRLGG